MTPQQAAAMLLEDCERARPLVVQALPQAPCANADEHVQWARVCVQFGLAPQAIEQLELALRAQPWHAEAHLELALLYRERGEGARAAQQLERLLEQQPTHRGALAELAEIYREEGLYGRIPELAERAQAAGLEQTLVERLLQLAQREQEALELAEQPVGGAAAALAFSTADVARFLALFQGRENVYARQWYDPSGGTGYSPVHEPLTMAVVEQHLRGVVTVGIYLLRLDGTVLLFALDLDIEKEALEAARTDPAEARRLRLAVHEEGLRLLRVLAGYGLAGLLESSGYKGRHLWVFLERAESAELVYTLGQLLLERERPRLARGLRLEFFPRQPARRGKGLGNLIKLPLGVHRRTGRRGMLLDAQGQPASDPFALLRGVRRVPRPVLHRALQRLEREALAAAGGKKVGAAGGEVEGGGSESEHAPAAPVAGDSTSAELSPQAEARDSLAGPPPPPVAPSWTAADFELDPEIRHVLAHCPVLRELHRQVEAHRTLSHDERVVWRHALGHLPQGVLATNYLLRQCGETDPAMYLQSPLKGAPISCARIRKRIPGVAGRVGCNCSFSFAPQHYPTPTLHLLTMPAELRSAGAAVQTRPHEVSTEYLARRYALLQRRLEQTRQELEAVQLVLLERLRAGAERSVACEGGRYVLVEREGIEELLWQPEGKPPEEERAVEVPLPEAPSAPGLLPAPEVERAENAPTQAKVDGAGGEGGSARDEPLARSEGQQQTAANPGGGESPAATRACFSAAESDATAEGEAEHARNGARGQEAGSGSANSEA